MKLSISNLAWSAQQDEIMYANLEKLGFSGLEIAPTRLFPEQPYAHLKEMQAFRQRIAEEFCLCIPSMQSIWYGRQEELFADAQQRQILLDYTKKAVDFASAAECRNLVFGSPKKRCLYQNSDYETGLLFFSELAEYACAHGTVIGIEANPAIYETNYITTTQQALRLIQEVGSDGLRLNLDIGTMLANQEKADILSGAVKYIQHVHVSEPFLKTVMPHPLHGEVFRILKQENYQGYISVEMGRQPDTETVLDVMQYVRKAVQNAIS